MKTRKAQIFCLSTVFVVSALLLVADCQNSTQNSTTSVVYPTWLNSSQAQYEQYLTDSYNYFVSPQGNKVWACGMSLAWNELKRGILNGKDATFRNLDPLKQKIVDNLNSELFKKSDLNQNSYYVTSGFGQKTIDRINFQVRQKFPSMTFPPLDYNLQDVDFISYAYLYKHFMFEEPFHKLTYFTFRNTTVPGFDSSTSKMKNQVAYKYYNNTNDFMVQLQTSSPNDQILLWKTNQTGVSDAKFQKIMSMVMFYNSLPSTKIAKTDRFAMPVLNLEYDRTYKEMVKAHFTNLGFERYEIGDMKENIKLKFTNTGVTLQNQAIVVGLRSGFLFGKTFVLDNDFWLIMKEKNKSPYLMILIKSVTQTTTI